MSSCRGSAGGSWPSSWQRCDPTCRCCTRRVMRIMPSSITGSSSRASRTSKNPSPQRVWRDACDRCSIRRRPRRGGVARILVMDDDELLREALRVVLEGAGYEVLEASDGEVGLRLQREHAADLVVVDVFMPERDGLEVIKALRVESPQVKIIAVSGGGRTAQIEVLSVAAAFGAARTLVKP